jgi:hypothetical protein
MKKITYSICFLIAGLFSACSSDKSHDVAPKPDMKALGGKYQLTPDESARRNESRIWTITKIDDSHVDVKENLTADLNSKKPKITSRIFKNVLVLGLETSGSVLKIDSDFEDSEFLVNGKSNYKIAGNCTVQTNTLIASLSFRDLSIKENNPQLHQEFMEFEKIE